MKFGWRPCKNPGSVKPIKWVVRTKIRYPQIHGFIIHISFKVYWCSFPGTSIPHSGRIQLSYCWLVMLCIPFYPHENHSWPSRCHSDQDHVCHWVAEVDRWLDFKDVVDLFKGCRPCRRPRKNRQGSQANWHKNSSVLRTLRLSTFFLCILLWNIFDRFEFSFVNGFFMIYWLSWSRRSLCMSIQVRAMWSGGGSCLGSCFRFGVNLQ